MRKVYKNIGFGMALLSGVALAAVTFVTNQQPFGYIAPATLSKPNISGGDAVSFVPWFERESYRGDIIAGTTSATGIVNLATPLWRAGAVLDAQDWDLGRKIFTMHKDGYAVPFRADTIDSGSQLDKLKDDKNERLDFIRGDRSEEGGIFGRVRVSVLGDIIHSNPVHVGVPRGGYTGNGYPAFAYANRARPGMVYVGANDGMLHAFDAATGTERWAYIPYVLFDQKLKLLANDPYVHQYLVDGPITVDDAQKADGTWYTALVSGLGAGGRAYFALDVTSAAAPATEVEAATKFMWEFSDDDDGAVNYTYARPSIVKLNDGVWYAVVGSGYMGEKKAKLLIINLETGALTRKIEASGGGDNGLSSPTLVDVNKDGKADYAYAGDLNGNLWKFDLTSTLPASWAVAYGGEPLFTTDPDPITGDEQPITTAPEIGRHPTNGLMVYFATGRLLANADALADEGASVQSVYGIRDNNWDPLTVPIPQSDLLNQSLRRGVHSGSGDRVRTATDYAIDWTLHRGWRTDLRVEAATAEEIGERVLQDVILKSGRVQFVSTNPTFASGENWLMQLNAMNGGAPGAPVVDLNGDSKFSILDNVDGDASGAVEEVAQDRVVGLYQGFGLSSRPSIASAGSAGDAAILNHLYTTDPWTNPEDDNTPDAPDDPGFAGGHIDVDTATEMYPLDGGDTNKHEHEWDNSHNLTILDFFDLQDTGFDYIDEAPMPQASGALFIINVANAHLSPGGVIEINGIGTPVKEYRALTKRYLAGNLGEGETFPVYKLTAPSVAETNQGVVQLTSFKMAFATNALLIGGVHPTATGCVRGNEPGQNNEYRNGALTVQALDASNLSPGYTYNPVTDAWHTASNAIHSLGYAFPNNGALALEDDGTMFWETTIFWHWGGGCYTLGDKEKYDENYATDIGEDNRGTDGDISDDPPPPPPDPDPDPPPEDPGFTSDPSTSTINVSSTNETGRLSWQELIPDNN